MASSLKTSESLEIAGKVSIVALDKTGTITKGTAESHRPCSRCRRNGKDPPPACLLTWQQKMPNNPLAKAVVEEALSRKLAAEAVDDFSILPGNGLTAKKETLSFLAAVLAI